MKRYEKKPAYPIHEQVKSVLTKHEIDADTPIVVAVSGGVDSSVLAAVASEMGFRHVALGHVEHGIRSEEEGKRDRITVDTLAARLHLPLFARAIASGTIEERVHREGGSIEAIARQERYERLREIVHDWSADCGLKVGVLVTGHHKNDVGESFLMHLVSGRSALESVTIPEVSEIQGVRVVRPLLTVTRRMIESHAEKHEIPWRGDPTNDDESYLRNFVRHTVIPTVYQRYPGVERALPKFAGEVEALREGVADLLPRAAWGDAFYTNLAETAWRIDRPLFVNLPRIAQELVLRRAVQRISQSQRLSFGAMQEHVRALRHGAPVYVGDVEIVPSMETIEVRRRIVRSLESGYLLEVPTGSFIEIDVATNSVVCGHGVATRRSMRFSPLTAPIVARGAQRGDKIDLCGVKRRIVDIDSSGRNRRSTTPRIVIEDPMGVAVVFWSASEWITRDGVANCGDHRIDFTSLVVQIKD